VKPLDPVSHDLSGRRSAPEAIPWFARWKYSPVYGYFIAAGFLIFAIRTPEESVGSLVIEDAIYLSLPLGLLIFWTTYRHRLFLYRTKPKRYQVWFQSLFVWLFAVLAAFPYQLAWNATSLDAPVVDLHGIVLSKPVSYGRSTSYKVVIDEQTFHRRLTFRVSKSDYQQIGIGDEYSERMIVGRLGIPYRWRWQRL